MAKLKRGQSKYMKNIRAKASTTPTGNHARAMPADKGKYGGHCNRSACLRPYAYWYNWGSLAHYCTECAHLLNDDFLQVRGNIQNFNQLLCLPPQDADVHDMRIVDGDHPQDWAVQYADGRLEHFRDEASACSHQLQFRMWAGLDIETGEAPHWYKAMTERFQTLRSSLNPK